MKWFDFRKYYNIFLDHQSNCCLPAKSHTLLLEMILNTMRKMKSVQNICRDFLENNGSLTPKFYLHENKSFNQKHQTE